MRFSLPILGLSLVFLSNCAFSALTDGTLDYGFDKQEMYRTVDKVQSGEATRIAAADLPQSGTVDFSGFFNMFEGDVDKDDILFGAVAVTYDFGAVDTQLTGQLTDIRLIDPDGKRYYGLPGPKMREQFTGIVAISGTFNPANNNVPLSGSGTISDAGGTDHLFSITAAPAFFTDPEAFRVMNSSASGTLSSSAGAQTEFSNGNFALVER